MEENKKEFQEKPTEEQLKYWLDKTLADNKQLMHRLQQITDALNILPYLFKIVEFENKFSIDMVNKSKTYIYDILFSHNEPVKEESQEESEESEDIEDTEDSENTEE